MTSFQNTKESPSVSEKPTYNNSMPSSESAYVPPNINFPNINPPETNKTDSNKNKPETDETFVNVTPASVTIETRKNDSSFKIFVIVGILIILIIYGAVAYIYYKNKNAKLPTMEVRTTEISNSPKAIFEPQNILIGSGSIVYKNSAGEVKTLVDKNSYPSTGITGFARVVVSPDNMKMCFESIPPSTKPALFVSDVEGIETKQISAGKSSCIWNSNSNVIYYVGKENGIPNANLYVYDLEKSIETNLTSKIMSDTKPDFTLVGLSSDETKLICTFTNPNSEESVSCQIDLATQSFSTL